MDWWKLIGNTRSPAEMVTMAWPEFSELFKEKFIPAVEIQQLTGDFISLRHNIETLNEITAMFYEKSLFFLEYLATEPIKMSKYSSMWKDDICKCVSSPQGARLSVR